jgi:hypothetical protein
MTPRRALIGWVLACLILPAAQAPQAQSADRLTDEAFAALSTTLSEDGGAFPVENFVSNERSFLYVLDDLRERVKPGGVYVGVGPEQNFTFISAVRPALVFLLDIRRQNMLEHLMYKMAFEASASRADFLSYLFARPRPPNLTPDMNITALLRAYLNVVPKKDLSKAHENAALEALHTRFPGLLTDKDDKVLRHLYSTFYEGGPLLTYVGPRPPVANPGVRSWATMATLLASTDGQGRQRSYLASEEGFLFVKGLHERNLMVPVVGDFAGPKAIRAVGEYVAGRKMTVTTFYCSNVEQYLFRDTRFKPFYDSVLTLPLDDTSMFIRSFDKPATRMSSAAAPTDQNLFDDKVMTAPMRAFLAAYTDGKIKTHMDVERLSK